MKTLKPRSELKSLKRRAQPPVGGADDVRSGLVVPGEDKRNVPINHVFPKLLEKVNAGCKVVVLEGGSRSGKTRSVVLFVVLECLKAQTVARCFRHDGTTHAQSTVQDFKVVMQEQLGQWEKDRWNENMRRYRFPNGSMLTFEATNNLQDLHGMTQDIAWLNEVMEVSEESWGQISMRTRRLALMDFNPTFNHHWVFSRVLSRVDDPKMKVGYIHSTYTDNPYLTELQRWEIEKYDPARAENIKAGTADQWHWDVYGLGKRGKVQGAVFKMWETTLEWPRLEVCQRHGYGLDFGFSLDPAACIECAFWRDRLYLREVFYETGLIVGMNTTRPNEPSIVMRLQENCVDKDSPIYCDPAQPESIRVLQMFGYNVVAATKKADSILHGIDLMKQRKLFVHRSSQNLQMELEKYCWKKNPDGTYKREPIDRYNHAIDGTRYWCLMELDRQIVMDQMLGRTKQQPQRALMPGRPR